MEMFNKLKSTLSTSVTNTIQNTVYNTGNIISGVIPGNPVTREYEITSHVGSAGPGLLWKVYSAIKKSTRQPASVFVLERAQLDKFDRQDREVIWDLFKKGVSQLTRLRHPQILTVEHPLEESRDCLAFATEPVLASLANVLGWQDNLPSPLPSQLQTFKLFPVEIKYGLLQVSEGLSFLHGSGRMLHRNLSPESILINSQGAWKISGFEYCLSSVPGGQGVPSWDAPEFDHALPALAYPHLDYSAPEFALLGTVSPAADMFSFGMLAFCVHTRRSLYHCERNWGTYKRNVTDLKSVPADRLTSVPSDLVEYIKLLLSKTPELRPTPEEIQQLEFFQDVGVKTLQLLDSQFQWDNLQKSQFYKGLPGVLPQLPHRVALHRVYPCLAKEFVNNSMVPFVLPTAIQISKDATKEDFEKYILPALKPVMKIMEPIQILLIFMQNMELILEKTPTEDVKSDVLPMLYRALECDVSQIQELCLSILPEFAGLLDRQALKTAFLPRIKKVCISTRLLSVRVNSLICLGKLLEYLDKWQVIDEVLPMFSQIPSREPAVIMGMIGIYKISLNSSKLGFSKEVLASKVLPFLIPLSVENGLTVKQYDSICELIKDMMTRVESEHRNKLQQLNSLQEDHKKSFQVGLPAGQLVSAPTLSQTSEMDSMFSGLGLGSYLSKESCGQDDTLSKNRSSVSPIPRVPGVQTNQSQALSLQEKQRMLQEQESLQRNHGKPTPTPTLNSKPTPSSMAPRSTQNQTNNINQLSDALVKKSLSMNSFPTSTNNFPTSTTNFPTFTNFATSTNNFPTSTNNFPTTTNFPTSTNNFPTSTSNFSTNNILQPNTGVSQGVSIGWGASNQQTTNLSSTLGNSMSNNSMFPGSNNNFMGYQSNPAQSGMSSLDSMFTSKPNPSFNSLQSNTGGLLQPQQTKPQAKPLSQSDINDLLG